MEWKHLLCPVRTRELNGSQPTPTEPGEARSQFERDYDRTVFSTTLRRMQSKTQVFPLEEHDAVRTRLTHSLEVSTVARNLGRGAADWMLAQGHLDSTDQARAIETIAATSGLVHDMGNPPFGHAGEFAMREWFARAAERGEFEGLSDGERLDFLSFEGNAQTLRLLTRLQVGVHQDGLNLTCGTISATCKYTASSAQAGAEGAPHEREKVGYFQSEGALVQAVRERTGTGIARHPITYLAEAADNICYFTADLEDGIKKGILDWASARAELLAHGGSIARDVVDSAEAYMARAKEAGDDQAEAEDVCAQYFRIFAMGRLTRAVLESYYAHYPEIMAGEYGKELIYDCPAQELAFACQQLNKTRIFPAREITTLELMGRRVIGELMDFYWEGISSYSEGSRLKGFQRSIWELVSRNYREVFRTAQAAGTRPLRYAQLQLLADQLCGMTDTFACKLHKRLMNSR